MRRHEGAGVTDTLDTQQIAELLHLKRRYVTDEVTKRPGFPEPVINVSRKIRRWDRESVLRWASRPSR